MPDTHMVLLTPALGRLWSQLLDGDQPPPSPIELKDLLARKEWHEAVDAFSDVAQHEAGVPKASWQACLERLEVADLAGATVTWGFWLPRSEEGLSARAIVSDMRRRLGMTEVPLTLEEFTTDFDQNAWTIGRDSWTRFEYDPSMAVQIEGPVDYGLLHEVAVLLFQDQVTAMEANTTGWRHHFAPEPGHANLLKRCGVSAKPTVKSMLPLHQSLIHRARDCPERVPSHADAVVLDVSGVQQVTILTFMRWFLVDVLWHCLLEDRPKDSPAGVGATLFVPRPGSDTWRVFVADDEVDAMVGRLRRDRGAETPEGASTNDQHFCFNASRVENPPREDPDPVPSLPDPR